MMSENGRREATRVDDFTAMMARVRSGHPANGCKEEYECQECRDTGYVVKLDEEGREFATRCRCFAIRRTRGLLRYSGISEEFCKKTFANFTTGGNGQLEKAKNKAMQYVAGFAQFENDRFNSILFAGQVGAGKTHLGMAICNELLNAQGVGVIYMPYRDAVTKIKQTVMDRENYNAAIWQYCNARLLYIDDLLKGRLTEADLNILYELVNYRYMHNKPMVISTEKTPESLVDFDEAVGSRILEMCRGNIVIFRGQELNYRLYS